MPSNIGLTVGVPSSGRPVAPEWALSMMIQSYPANTSIGIMVMFNHEVGEARDRLVEEALKTNSEYIWFVDDDTSPPYFAAAKLLCELRTRPDVAVVGGIYCARNNPPDPLVYRGNGHGAFWNWSLHDVFEVTGIATGCMMVRTSIFKTLERPWFSTTLVVPDTLTDGEVVVSEGMTDDLYFCEKVRAAGHKVYAHGGVLCEHWDAPNRTKYFLPPDSLPYRNFEAGKHTAPMIEAL